MDILREGWSPAFTISKVLLATKAIIANLIHVCSKLQYYQDSYVSELSYIT